MRYRGAVRTMRHLSDFGSRWAMVSHGFRYGGFPASRTLPDQDKSLLELHIRELGDRPIWCRAGLSDLSVVYDTFDGGYHLPPKNLRPVGTILDLGSNIGLTMAHFAVLYPEARIFGVEIDAGNIELCRKNIAPWSDRCRLVHAAVWHETCEVSYGGARESGYAVLNGRGGREKGRVRGVTLDGLLGQLELDLVDYVKMDIEGAEKEVLADASRWADRVRCLKVEVHPDKVQPRYSIETCISDLERHGFHCSLESRHESCIIANRDL